MSKFIRNPIIIFLAVITQVLLISSCTDFFSSSWFPFAARDSDKLIPAVTSKNVDDLVQQFENDPDGSLALLKKIKEAADKANEEELKKYQLAALDASVNAAGLGQAALGALNNLDKLQNVDDAYSLLQDTINNMPNLGETSSTLLDLLNSGSDDFIEDASAESLAMAAVVLILGITPTDSQDDLETFVSNLADHSGENATVDLAIKMAAAANDKKDELADNSMLKKILDQMKLT